MTLYYQIHNKMKIKRLHEQKELTINYELRGKSENQRFSHSIYSGSGEESLKKCLEIYQINKNRFQDMYFKSLLILVKINENKLC